MRAYQRGVKNTLDSKDDAVKIMLKYVKLDPAGKILESTIGICR